LFFAIDYEDDDEEEEFNFEGMEGDRLTKVGDDGDFTNNDFVTLEGMTGFYKGAIWHLEAGSSGILFGQKPMLDDLVPDTCLLTEMSQDKEMKPTHAYFEYVPGRGVHVIDKSGGLTYITYTVLSELELPQFIELGWAQLGQSVKIGGTVLKIEIRRRPLED
jgi:hypothetical protein